MDMNHIEQEDVEDKTNGNALLLFLFVTIHRRPYSGYRSWWPY
ncbi:hypothetical protein HMPREF9012_0671 [Bacteroidetes bacterium oral taxon 272 str. F0290]|nr:hypothetical protein HMPREF9012_0671 [Bacteroidetes bacterium oral taxon 272 str. F0290]